MHAGKQRRIRQIRAILGRNIGWNSVASAETPDYLVDPITSSSSTGRTVSSSLPSTHPTAFSISPSLSSSASSSVSPSSAWLAHSPLHASRSLQLVKQPTTTNSNNNNSNSKYNAPPLGDSCPPNLSPEGLGSPHLHHKNHHHYPSPMRRSESATFLNTMAVADSSLTKSAYKRNSKTSDTDGMIHWDDPPAAATVAATTVAVTASHDETDGCLAAKEERGLLDAYLTLAVQPDGADVFYTSETIPNSTNPAFRIDMSLVNWYDGVQSMVMVCVCARHSLPESASIARQGDHSHASVGPPFNRLIEWSVDLDELVYIGKSLYGTHSWPDNTLLFELDDGYYTSPDIAAFALGQQKRIHHLDMHMDMDNASIASAQSPRIKRSYTYHHIMKLNTLQDCIFDAERSAHEVQSNINQILETEKDAFRLVRERSQKETRLKELESTIKETQDRMDQDRQQVETLRKSLATRKLQLKKSQERFQRGSIDLENNNTQLEKNIQMHNDTFNKLNERRKELIADLFSIYPIEQSFDDFTQFRIRGIYLPNSVYTGCDEESVATALGYTSHLVHMLAIYLSIPLRYPINPMGSRASIYDPVSLINGSRSFALYGKGVDRYRFEFGVFLLNKNIEQMMNAYGLIVMDLRHTLPNIHYFIQAVLTTSVHSGPTSMSVLSISSYAQGKEGPDCSSRPPPSTVDHLDADTHLTLHTTRSIPVPPPNIPSSSVSSKFSISPGVRLSTHGSAAPAVVDAVTTASCHKPPQQDSC